MHLKDDDIKRLQKEVDKDLGQLLSWKIGLPLAIAAFIVVFVSTLSGMNTSWAREVAGSLITADGLLLGFVILGTTVFSRRGLTKAAYETMIRNSMNQFFERISQRQTIDTSVEDYLEKEFLQVLAKPALAMALIQSALSFSAKLLLISVGFAFALYGVGDTTATNPILFSLFNMVYVLAFLFLVLGAYMVLGSTFAIINRGTRMDAKETFKLINDLFDEKIEEEEKKKKANGEGKT